MVCVASVLLSVRPCSYDTSLKEAAGHGVKSQANHSGCATLSKLLNLSKFQFPREYSCKVHNLRHGILRVIAMVMSSFISIIFYYLLQLLYY